MKVITSLALIFILSSSDMTQAVSIKSDDVFIKDQCFQERSANSKQQHMELEFFYKGSFFSVQKKLVANTEKNHLKPRNVNETYRKLIRRAAF